jgi:cytochrome c oxidase assembly factor CtaG/cytochrome c2
MLWHLNGPPLAPRDLAAAWTLAPAQLLGLGALAVAYARGVRAGRGIRSWEAWCFLGGWSALALALLSPVHALGESLFSAHMVQHELLMVVAAPLLVLGRPMLAFLWAMPVSWRRAVGRWARGGVVRGVWGALARPSSAWVIQAVVLWGWHLRGPFEAALRWDSVHALEHLAFLGAALLFWWVPLHGRGARMARGGGVIYFFTTALHTTVLGAFLTFAPTPWYTAYGARGAAWGLSPLADQQLAGLVMWVPAGIAYLVAGLAMVAASMRESGRRAVRREAFRTASALSLLFLLVLTACGPGPKAMEQGAALTGGDPYRGRVAIRRYGCDACHTIPGVAGASREVGPPLSNLAERMYIAGVLANNADNLVAWIQNPPRIDSLTAMPYLGVSEADARDIAAYLYAVR